MGYKYLFRLSINTNDFDYSTVIYASPFDSDHTNFFIYLNKKDRLAINEDHASLLKQHKLLDTDQCQINPRDEFLLIEYTKIFDNEKFCRKTPTEIFGKQCPYKNCLYSCNKTLASQAQLLLFHKYDVNPKTMPPTNFTRKSSQIWLLWHDEPNFYHGYDLNVYKFNWTISYVFDAEASIGAYGTTIIRDQFWSNEQLDEYINREYSSRQQQALWFVTNCGAKRRLNYFRQLREYFPIQVFGSCVKLNESLPSLNVQELAKKMIRTKNSINQSLIAKTDCNRWSSCEQEQVNLNMFYLAFESQSCKDYITEKFWRALKYGLIPSKSFRNLMKQPSFFFFFFFKYLVVLGPLSREYYRRIAPPNSFIYTNDYPTVKSLVQHLYEIINNKGTFRFYHQWRRYYHIGYTSAETEKYRMCEVCHRLNTMTRHQYYPDVRGFFTQQC